MESQAPPVPDLHTFQAEAVEIMGGISDFAGGTFLFLHPASGRRLFQFRCQPDVCTGEVAVADGIEFWVLDSGIRHKWGQKRYEISRCAAFMGKRMVEAMAPSALAGKDGKSYLANLGSDRWRALRLRVPKTITGEEFIATYGEHVDGQTAIDPGQNYEVRLAAEYHIYEADRVLRFAELLRSAGENPAARADFLAAAGDLMIQSHFSLDHRCQLGAPETDLLMNLAREAGPEQGVYGAKVTGRGAAGAVVVLTDRMRNSEVGQVMERAAAAFRDRTGFECGIRRISE